MTPASLTPRQREVMAELVHGRSNAQIAAVLGISKDTVDNHLTQAAARIGVECNRVLLAVWWTRREAWAAFGLPAVDAIPAGAPQPSDRTTVSATTTAEREPSTAGPVVRRIA